MTYDRSLVSFIEAALDATPSCRSCGAQTTVRADEDRVILTCSAADRPSGLLGRIAAKILPHERSVILAGMG